MGRVSQCALEDADGESAVSTAAELSVGQSWNFSGLITGYITINTERRADELRQDRYSLMNKVTVSLQNVNRIA